ncbi:PTS sugar transporter subunit IIA [Acidithrix sp. C25]|uniref:PTS sugar transporter subunit IIA n=1 Tax=Acidithrix sp. C25 TaxID=1671482 RepID=UPI00191B95FE|nr:PTS sugar transporter subunit IIA [Acidithrix sp. C25]
MTPIISTVTVDLNMTTTDKVETIKHLIGLLDSDSRLVDPKKLLDDVLIREGQMQTGLEGGIGIPHARSGGVVTPSLAFGRSVLGVDFGASDGKADLVFLIAIPEGSEASHMKLLAALARRLIHDSFKSALREAKNAQEVVELIEVEVVAKTK